MPKPQVLPDPRPVQVPAGLSFPMWDLYRDGVSYSALSKFLSCRHRFWLHYVAGIREAEEYRHYIEYGNLFDKARGVHANSGSMELAIQAARNYGHDLHEKFPGLPTEGKGSPNFWTDLFCKQYRLYCKHWNSVESNNDFSTSAQQLEFREDYTLPDGRVIPIKGIYDEVQDHKQNESQVSLTEDKCKGDPDILGIQRGLTYEGQTGLYLTALRLQGKLPMRLWYNLMVRPQGGYSALRQKKGRLKGPKGNQVRVGAQSESEFITEIIKQVEDDPDAWFKRWPLHVSSSDIDEYERKFLKPIFFVLANWWDSIKDNPEDPWHTECRECGGSGLHFGDGTKSCVECKGICFPENPHHYQKPFGFYDPMKDGWRGPYWEYLTTGSPAGLTQRTT